MRRIDGYAQRNSPETLRVFRFTTWSRPRVGETGWVDISLQGSEMGNSGGRGLERRRLVLGLQRENQLDEPYPKPREGGAGKIPRVCETSRSVARSLPYLCLAESARAITRVRIPCTLSARTVRHPVVGSTRVVDCGGGQVWCDVRVYTRTVATQPEPDIPDSKSNEVVPLWLDRWRRPPRVDRRSVSRRALS